MNIAANIVKHIRRLSGSIRARLLMFFVVALAVSLVLAGLNIRVVTGDVMNRMRESSIQAEFSQIHDSLVNQMDSVNIQISILRHDSNLSALMNPSVFEPIDQVQIQKNFRKTVMSLLDSFPMFRSVGLYSEKDECLMVFSSKSTQNYYDEASVGWIREKYASHRLGETSFFAGEEVQYGSPLMMHFSGSGQVVCALVKIRGGMLLLAYQEQMLADQYKALVQVNGNDVYIYGNDGTILSSSDRNAIRSAYVLPETKELQVYSRSLGYGGVEFSYHVPADTGYMTEMENLSGMTVISLIMAFIVTAGIFLFWLKRMMRPINGISESIAYVEHGDYSMHVDAAGSDELSKLARKYNSMLVSLKDLTDENVRVEQQRRNYELQSLRNQINPHFLYNTLNAIKWMALMEGNEKVAGSLTSLGGLLSPLLRAPNPLCTLREEMDLSYKYMSLMNVRYMVEIPLEADIPEDLLDAAVPRLCLQPILENTILHGFAPEKKWGCIAVCACEEDGYIFIDVIDDGMGMDDAEIENLNARLESGEQSDHIGIVNTNMRIRLHYGEDCGLRILKNSGGGLCVRIKMRRMAIGQDVSKPV